MKKKKHSVFRFGRAKPTRFRFTVARHNGKRVRERLGFRGNKVVEVSFYPMKRRSR